LAATLPSAQSPVLQYKFKVDLKSSVSLLLLGETGSAREQPWAMDLPHASEWQAALKESRGKDPMFMDPVILRMGHAASVHELDLRIGRTAVVLSNAPPSRRRAVEPHQCAGSS